MCKKNDDSSNSMYVQKADLLSRFILLGEDPEQNFTDKTLRDIILNFIIAGEHARNAINSLNRHLPNCQH